MVDNNERLLAWDADYIFSLDFSDNHYKLTQQHIEVLVAIFPAIEWDTRWYNTDLYDSDTRQAFAAELMTRLMSPVDCAEQEIDNCLEYANNVSFLSYTPQNPHTEPDLVPDGYPNQPFFKFGSIVPEFLPEWLEGLVGDWLTDMTGYEENDVLTVINSFPIFANWQELITSGLPRITIAFSGIGIVQIKLLLVPFGGRALISIDVEPNLADILENLFEGNIRSVELERDLSSIPMETDSDHIEEIVFTEDIEHTIYITFLPVVDATLLPLKYGGGIRSITFCGEFAFAEPPAGDIPTIIADDTFFEEEYVPIVFGDYYSSTVSHYETLLAAHDDTPQSVAPLVPTGAPDVLEDNALCYAVNRFVEAYSTQKTCLIQSQNFIENILSDMAHYMNDLYDGITNLMLPFYSPNIFSCFVDDTSAITALTDSAAWEDLACFIYEELKSVAMSQSNFDDAILAAATDLTGNAQDIACLMQNDNNETVYISFLQAYNIALQRQADNEDLDCPCETATYRTWIHNFTSDLGPFVNVFSGNEPQGVISGGRLVGSDLGSVRRISIAWNNFNMAWRVRAVKIYYERTNGIFHGSNDYQEVRMRPNVGSNTGATGFFTTGAAGNGVGDSCGSFTTGAGYVTGARQLNVFLSVSDPSDASAIYLDRIEIQFLDGYGPGQGILNDVSDWCV